MTKNKNFAIEEETFRRLKSYAAAEGLKIGAAIKTLLDLQQIPIIRPGRGYSAWLLKVLAVGDKEGPEAAQKFIEDHPYEASNA